MDFLDRISIRLVYIRQYLIIFLVNIRPFYSYFIYTVLISIPNLSLFSEILDIRFYRRYKSVFSTFYTFLQPRLLLFILLIS